jgi:hypothetical protein
MRKAVLADLYQSKDELKKQVSQHHMVFASADLEIHDLSLFLPGFTSARAKGLKSLSR